VHVVRIWCLIAVAPWFSPVSAQTQTETSADARLRALYTSEIDRYIAWPGQALAYKLGELQIRRHRREAEEKLGAKFDQRRFHDAILAIGSVPLPVLEQRMAQFIADESAALNK
jgi:uncharacterized protein (DUF885 family)